jgi:hypothetical protein
VTALSKDEKAERRARKRENVALEQMMAQCEALQAGLAALRGRPQETWDADEFTFVYVTAPTEVERMKRRVNRMIERFPESKSKGAMA